jgi:micrococcal nuclease
VCRLARALPPAAALAAALAACAPAPARASPRELAGTAYATDGDTLRVGGVAVRLQGVAAPELAHPGLGIRGEPGGPAAAAFMRELVDGEGLVCDLTGERTHAREVGVCRLDGRDVGAALVAAGLARDCPAHSGGRYASFETAAAASLPFPGYCAVGSRGRGEGRAAPGIFGGGSAGAAAVLAAALAYVALTRRRHRREAWRALRRLAGSVAPRLPPAFRPAPAAAGVRCPSCGAAMRRRVAERGRHAGRPFWGCSRFPACRGVRAG